MGARYQILVEGKQDVVLRSTNLACMQNTREPFSRSPMPRTCVCAPCSSATAEAIVACVMCFVKRRTRAVAHERALVTAMRFAIKHPERRQHLRLELRNESREWRRGDVHSFNSFLGLPEQRTEPGTWPTWDKRLAPLRRGTFSQGGKPPFDAEGIVWHVGWFNETLPRFLAERQEPVGVLHVDCDIYSSTASVLELIEPRLLPGTVIVFDELINYPGYAAHELKAFVELLHRTGFGYRPIGASADRVVTDRAKLIAALSQPRMADVAIRQRLRGEDVAFELVGPPAVASALQPSRGEGGGSEGDREDGGGGESVGRWCPSRMLLHHPTARGFRLSVPSVAWRRGRWLRVDFDRAVNLTSSWGPVKVTVNAPTTLQLSRGTVPDPAAASQRGHSRSSSS